MIILLRESVASDQAKERGLHYSGWSIWASPDGTPVAKSVDRGNRLVPIERGEADRIKKKQYREKKPSNKEYRKQKNSKGLGAPMGSDNLSQDIVMQTLVRGAQGTNKGGTYVGKDTVERYVKQYVDPNQSRGEYITNAIYKALGIAVPESTIFPDKFNKSQKYFASTIVPNIKANMITKLPKEDQTMVANRFLDGAAADLLLANWDVVGLVYDNVMVTQPYGPETTSGTPVRIDNGSGLLFRAQGGMKPRHLLNQLTEWDGFADENINYQYTSLLKLAGYKSFDDMGMRMVHQIERIVALRDSHDGWHNIIEFYSDDQMSDEDKELIGDMLESRTNLLIDKARQIELRQLARGQQILDSTIYPHSVTGAEHFAATALTPEQVETIDTLIDIAFNPGNMLADKQYSMKTLVDAHIASGRLKAPTQGKGINIEIPDVPHHYMAHILDKITKRMMVDDFGAAFDPRELPDPKLRSYKNRLQLNHSLSQPTNHSRMLVFGTTQFDELATRPFTEFGNLFSGKRNTDVGYLFNKSVRSQLPKAKLKKLADHQTDWQRTGNWNTEGRKTRNKFFNQFFATHQTHITHDAPIYRGMAIKLEEFDQFISKFQPNKKTILPPSGFTTIPLIARDFRYGKFNVPAKSITIRQLPKKGGHYGIPLYGWGNNELLSVKSPQQSVNSNPDDEFEIEDNPPEEEFIIEQHDGEQEIIRPGVYPIIVKKIIHAINPFTAEEEYIIDVEDDDKPLPPTQFGEVINTNTPEELSGVIMRYFNSSVNDTTPSALKYALTESVASRQAKAAGLKYAGWSFWIKPGSNVPVARSKKLGAGLEWLTFSPMSMDQITNDSFGIKVGYLDVSSLQPSFYFPLLHRPVAPDANGKVAYTHQPYAGIYGDNNRQYLTTYHTNPQQAKYDVLGGKLYELLDVPVPKKELIIRNGVADSVFNSFGLSGEKIIPETTFSQVEGSYLSAKAAFKQQATLPHKRQETIARREFVEKIKQYFHGFVADILLGEHASLSSQGEILTGYGLLRSTPIRASTTGALMALPPTIDWALYDSPQSSLAKYFKLINVDGIKGMGSEFHRQTVQLVDIVNEFGGWGTIVAKMTNTAPPQFTPDEQQQLAKALDARTKQLIQKANEVLRHEKQKVQILKKKKLLSFNSGIASQELSQIDPKTVDVLKSYDASVIDQVGGLEELHSSEMKAATKLEKYLTLKLSEHGFRGYVNSTVKTRLIRKNNSFVNTKLQPVNSLGNMFKYAQLTQPKTNVHVVFNPYTTPGNCPEFDKIFDDLRPHSSQLEHRQNYEEQVQYLKNMTIEDALTMVKIKTDWQKHGLQTLLPENRIRISRTFSQLCRKYNPSVTREAPVFRGLSIPPEDLDQFISHFKIDSSIQLPSSGFTNNLRTARTFSEPNSVFQETEVLIALHPNTQKKIHGLFTNGWLGGGHTNVFNRLHSDEVANIEYLDTQFEEYEFMRPSNHAVRVRSIDNIVNGINGQGVYVIQLEEGELLPSHLTETINSTPPTPMTPIITLYFNGSVADHSLEK